MAHTPKDIPASDGSTVERDIDANQSAKSFPVKEQIDWDNDTKQPTKSFPAVIIEEESNLEKGLGHLLNKHSAENESGTPDFILAMFLKAQLDLFNQTIKNRAVWRGESVELPALLSLHRDTETMDRVIAFLRSKVEEGVIDIKEPIEATDLYRELMDYQPPEPVSTKDDSDHPLQEPKDEPLPESRKDETSDKGEGAFWRYQTRGLTDNG